MYWKCIDNAMTSPNYECQSSITIYRVFACFCMPQTLIFLIFFGSLRWWFIVIKLMKGKSTRKHACTRKQQPQFYWSYSSVVTTDATPLTHERNSIFKCSIHLNSMLHEDQKNITTQWGSMGRLFTAATQALNTRCSKVN